MYIVIAGEKGAASAEFEQALQDFGIEWDVCWCPDATSALALPADRAVDVVVAGSATNDMPGATLLSRMRELSPGAVRILLMDGDADGDAQQVLESAHRLLRRPLDPGELIEAVESVVELRELLDNPQLKQLIGGIQSLPTPPHLYIDLCQLLQDRDTDSADVAELLCQDPATAAKVLRLCNSAYFSAGRVVTDIRAAVVRLGFQTIKRLVLAAEVFSKQRAGGVDREAMQGRALRTSRLAGQILAGPSAELAATAGLLCEIGLLLPGIAPPGTPGGGQEGPHYAEAGAYLLGLWGVPMPIVEAVASHHAPARLRMSGFWVAGAVHVASALVGGTPLDEDYLKTVGVIDRLPRWRALADEVLEEAA